MPVYEDHGRSNPRNLPNGFQQTLLRGPVEDRLEKGLGQPVHDFSMLKSRAILNKFYTTDDIEVWFSEGTSLSMKPQELLVNAFVSQDNEKITAVISRDISLASKHEVARRLRYVSGLDVNEGNVIFAWPAEQDNLYYGAVSIHKLAGQNINPVDNVRFPVYIFVSTDADEPSLDKQKWLFAIDSILSLLSASVFQLYLKDDGSWRKRLLGTTSHKMTQADFEGRVDNVVGMFERAATGLRVGGTELNADDLTITKEMLALIGERKTASMMIGSLLVLKYDKGEGVVLVVRKLTRDQLIALECRPSVLADPYLILRVLERVAKEKDLKEKDLKEKDLRKQTIVTGGLTEKEMDLKKNDLKMQTNVTGAFTGTVFAGTLWETELSRVVDQEIAEFAKTREETSEELKGASTDMSSSEGKDKVVH